MNPIYGEFHPENLTGTEQDQLLHYYRMLQRSLTAKRQKLQDGTHTTLSGNGIKLIYEMSDKCLHRINALEALQRIRRSRKAKHVQKRNQG